MANPYDDPWLALTEGADMMLGTALGYNLTSFRNVQGKSASDFASRWTSDLGNLKGYYDTGKVNTLIGGLGSTSSETYLSQLQALSSEANKVYTYIQNPNSITNALQAYSEKVGYNQFLGMMTGYMPKREGKPIHMSGGYYADMMGNRSDVLMSPTMKRLYAQVDRIKGYQDNLAQQLNAQQQKENSFVTQINQITQQATLAKTKAEQQAAADKLNQQYQQQQAALDKQAQANKDKLAQQQAQQAKELAAQQAKQAADYAAAQAKAAEQARQQQLTLNKSALTSASSTVANSALQQAKLTVAQQEAAAGQTRGGEATVSTNAAPAKTQKGVSTRTERWQSTRQPAAGGGGIRA